MRNILVVGALRGIGQALCEQLARRGDKVIATTRTPAQLEGVEVITGLDVSRGDDVSGLVRRLDGRPIDDVIVVAGILERNSLEDLDLGSVERQLEVNAIGPLRVVHALLPRLHQGSRVALLTSRMGSISDNSSGGHYGYRMSKAALNMAGKSLAIDLRPRGISVRLLHPGFVRTEMTGGQGMLSTDESAGLLIQRFDEMTLESTGQLVHANGEQLPW